MPTQQDLDQYRAVQHAAKRVLSLLAEQIGASDTEHSIAEKAHALLAKEGYPETWYYDCPALVLLGNRSCVSVSGRQYVPQHEAVGQLNLITIDLSPANGEYWGDCARSFAIEAGQVTECPKLLEFQNGLLFLQDMHRQILRLAKPETTFSQLFEWANLKIRQSGFVNLDYRNNVGHSLASNRDERQFIDANNHTLIGQCGLFSFEPFIRAKGGKWGFKHESVFYFDSEGSLQEL